MTPPRIQVWLGSVLALVLLALGAVATAPTAAASDVGGPVSRAEILARADFWVARNVPYNIHSMAPDGNGRLYRQDCSGFVSMAWHLGASATTQTLAGYGDRLSGLDALRPGDMLLSAGQHVVLFVGWNDPSHLSATVWHESRPGVGTVSASLSRTTMSSYVPYSYANVLNDAPAPDPTGPVPTTTKQVYTVSGGQVFEAASDNGWRNLGSGITTDGPVAATSMNGVKYVYTVTAGQVYEAASNNGWRNLPTGITTDGPLAVTSMNGVKYVYTVSSGHVHEAASDNAWRNLDTTIPSAGALSVTSTNGVKYVYTVSGGQVFEAASDNGWRNLGSGITTDGPVAATSMNGVKYVYTVTAGQVYEAASNNGWQNLGTGITTDGPLAVTATSGVKYVYTVSGGQVFEAASDNAWLSLGSGILAGTVLASTATP